MTLDNVEMNISDIPTALPPDLQKEMFIFGFCQEQRVIRRLQYLYERDGRVYWNAKLFPEILEETLYYDTDQLIQDEMEKHLESGDLDLAFIRASGPNARYDDF
jgi:hypothetical protein